jgi:hypothetical protein
VRSALWAIALALCVAGVPPSAHADPTDPPTDPTEEARRLFAEGSELFLKKRYEEALDAVQRSYLLVPSPNSALIAARCLRDLGRPEEAAQRFADAATQAEARAAAGEQQYVQTAEAARKEGALLRGTLANLRVRVANAPEGTTVETGATRTPVARGGLVELLHRPGRVVVVVRTPAGVAVRRAATLSAGAWTTVDVDVTAKEAPPAAPPPLASTSPTQPASAVGPAPVDAPARRRAWMFPAGLVLGGVGLVGIGSFVGFGLKSRATYDDLEDRCAPRCGAAERDEAEGGERDAMIANVALAVGAVGLVGGVTLVALGWPQNEPGAAAHRPAAPRRKLSLSFGPGGVAVRGSLP